MSVKVKQGITKCLTNIEGGTFDEDTIRTLLILSREHLNNDSLIKEIAHFIAHIDRTQGIFHRKINSRYAKFKLTQEQVEKVDIKELSKTIKTEDELSDFMLGGVSVEKIEAKLFNVLYSDGLDDLPESHLKKYTGFNKKEVKGLFEKFYTKKDGYYYLTTNITENLIRAFRALPTSKYNPVEEVKITEDLILMETTAKKIKTTIDGIQKVVRGAIYFNSVFDDNDFKTAIKNAVIELVNKFSIDERFIEIVQQQSDDILLCIMTLLHDSKFTFYDKNDARIFFCSYIDYNYEKTQAPDYDSIEDLYNNGVLALYISGDKTMTFPLFVSDLPIKKYINYELFMSNPSVSSMKEIPWTTAKRIDNTLQLTEEDL